MSNPDLSPTPPTPPAPTPPGKTAVKPDSMAEARESLAPSPTQFAHRPDWRATRDDEADAQRDRSGA